MKQLEDNKTLELLGPAKRGRGRPSTGSAMTTAERQKARRERLKAAGIGLLTVEVSSTALTGLRQFLEFKDMTAGQVIERLITKELLRKR